MDHLAIKKTISIKEAEKIILDQSKQSINSNIKQQKKVKSATKKVSKK